MLIYVADAFTDRCFGGNPAGIVLLDREHTFPTVIACKNLPQN